MNDRNHWRVMRYTPGVAHLWALTKGGIWRTSCGFMRVIDLDATTSRLGLEEATRKCRRCIPGEVRRKEAVTKENPAGTKPRRAVSAVLSAGGSS